MLSALPSASCTAIDIDPAAVSLAKVNANKLLLASTSVPSAGIDPSHCRYKVLHCSLQEFASRPDEQGQYDLVVSNPPYIPSSELETLEPEVFSFALLLHIQWHILLLLYFMENMIKMMLSIRRSFSLNRVWP